MTGRAGWFALAGGVALMPLLALRPVHDAALRFGWILAMALAVAGMLVLCRRRTPVAAVLLAPVILVLLLPDRELDRDRLREDCVEEMRRMEGVRYVWGGESGRGIDCSGLPRLALRRALLAQAAGGNRRALASWAEQWWFDTSAMAMRDGYRGFTVPTGSEGVVRDLDSTKLDPGDLAVTSGGNHVIVHLGGGDWIQADPGPGRVIISRPDEDDNVWFDSWVIVQRWSLLAEGR